MCSIASNCFLATLMKTNPEAVSELVKHLREAAGLSWHKIIMPALLEPAPTKWGYGIPSASISVCCGLCVIAMDAWPQNAPSAKLPASCEKSRHYLPDVPLYCLLVLSELVLIMNPDQIRQVDVVTVR